MSKKEDQAVLIDESSNDIEGDVSTLTKKQVASLVMNNPEALAMMQSKLAGMVGQMSGYYDTLPKVVKRRVKALKKIQVDVLKVEAEMAAAIHDIEVKFASQFEPFYAKRTQIVTGEYEPNDDECDFPSDEEEDDEEEEEGEEGSKQNGKKEEADPEAEKKKEADLKAVHGMDENTKGIPEFWLTILKNVELIGNNIQDHDEPILTHLTDIQVKLSPKPKMGFTLEFFFSPNEFFTNSVLTKHYELKAEVDPEDPFSFEGAEVSKCTGCEINWKKGKNVTVRSVTKKQKHKSKGNVRTVEKQVPNDSFFNFFTPPEVPEDPEEEMDEDTQDILAADYEIGEVIRQRLVQRAVLYFTGEALDEDDYEDEDDEDDEDMSGDEDEDEEDDEDFEPPKKGAKGKGGYHH